MVGQEADRCFLFRLDQRSAELLLILFRNFPRLLHCFDSGETVFRPAECGSEYVADTLTKYFPWVPDEEGSADRALVVGLVGCQAPQRLDGSWTSDEPRTSCRHWRKYLFPVLLLILRDDRLSKMARNILALAIVRPGL